MRNKAEKKKEIEKKRERNGVAPTTGFYSVYFCPQVQCWFT